MDNGLKPSHGSETWSYTTCAGSVDKATTKPHSTGLNSGVASVCFICHTYPRVLFHLKSSLPSGKFTVTLNMT